MRLTAKLALSQLKTNRNRSLMTVLGIVLSSGMLTAVCGFAASTKEVFDRATGYSYTNGSHNLTIVMLGALLGLIVVAASVIVVSNIFRVSAGERTRQFGILKSAGATKRQIAASVLYEGTFLSMIGIPIGIALGLLIDFVGLSVIENLLHQMTSGGTLHLDSEAYLDIRFTAPPVMFVIATAVSFGTVLLSAWLPANKASKISAIDAIRGAGEVSVKAKHLRTAKLTQKLFGFEGTLASKSLKRSSRSFRATVLSLTISMVLILAAGSFSTMMKSYTALIFPNIEANVELYWASDMKISFGENGQVESRDYVPLHKDTADYIAEKLAGFNNTQIFGIGKSAAYGATLNDGAPAEAELLTVDAVHYETLCKAAGVQPGDAILVNWRRETVAGKKREYARFDFSKYKNQTLTLTALAPLQESSEITLAGQLTGQDVPFELSYLCEAEMSVLVPDAEMFRYVWFANADDLEGFLSFGKKTLEDLSPKPERGIDVIYQCSSIADVMSQFDSLTKTIMLFVYGFSGMLALIAIASVISTISTNIRSRSREFAVLGSVGMSQHGIKRMLNLESVLCSVRSLMFGIPLGVLAAFLLYQVMGFSADLAFAFPWLSIMECVLGVFVITWLTMRFSAAHMRKSNIIEAIRGKSE